jgi:phage pi2 protein 07
MLKKTITDEKYQALLQYNRIYYASMSLEKKQKYLEDKRLYNKLFRERQKSLRL